MELKDVLKIWETPAESRLTRKQISIRLPIRVAAKLAALNDLYPHKSKTELVSDLLAIALDLVEKALPEKPSSPQHDIKNISDKFYQDTQRYLKELERENGFPPSTAGMQHVIGEKKLRMK